jgi:putative aldouronate transport system substrate-binding protein
MEWLNTDGYLLTTFGEEGKMWKRENGLIVVDQANDFRIVRALSAWSIKGSEEELRTRYDQTTSYPNGEKIAVWDIEQRAQNNPKTDITDFAVLPTAPADKSADLTRIIAEGEFGFASGQRPISDWDNYVQSVKAAGLNDWQAAADKRAKEAGLIK